MRRGLSLINDRSAAVSPTLILISPQRAGKTTIGKLLTTQRGLPFVDLGRQAEQFYAEQGHSCEEARRAWEGAACWSSCVTRRHSMLAPSSAASPSARRASSS
jgi:hypothetical protein